MPYPARFEIVLEVGIKVGLIHVDWRRAFVVFLEPFLFQKFSI